MLVYLIIFKTCIYKYHCVWFFFVLCNPEFDIINISSISYSRWIFLNIMSYEKEQIINIVPMNSRRKSLTYRLKQRSPEYTAGFFSSATNILLTYPVNKLIFRQQIYRLKTVHAFQQLKE